MSNTDWNGAQAGTVNPAVFADAVASEVFDGPYKLITAIHAAYPGSDIGYSILTHAHTVTLPNGWKLSASHRGADFHGTGLAWWINAREEIDIEVVSQGEWSYDQPVSRAFFAVAQIVAVLDSSGASRFDMTAERVKKLTGPDYRHEVFTTDATAAGPVDHWSPYTLAIAVYEAVDDALEINNGVGLASVTGPSWYVEFAYKADDDYREDVGIGYSMYRRTARLVTGSWTYGDRSAACRAINEIIETLTD